MTRAGRSDCAAVAGILAFGLIASLSFLWVDQGGFLRESEVRGQIFGRDLAVFWTASKMALSGRATDVFETATFLQTLRDGLSPNAGFNPFPYPPNGLLPILPLAILPYAAAFAVWMTGTLVAYLVAAAARAAAGASVVALIVAPATLLTVSMGQNGLLTASLFVGGLKVLDRAPVLAGMFFGLLAYKPQIGFLIPIALIAAKQWRCLFAAALTVATVVIWSLWFVGSEAWATYLNVTLPNQRVFLEEGTGFFLYMVPSPFVATRVLGAGAEMGYLVQAVVALCAVSGVVWVFRRVNDREVQWAVLLIGTFLVSPYVLNYDMTLASVAVMLLTLRAFKDGFMTGERLVLGALWLLPVFVMHANILGLPIGPIVLIAAFAYALARARQSRMIAKWSSHASTVDIGRDDSA